MKKEFYFVLGILIGVIMMIATATTVKAEETLVNERLAINHVIESGEIVGNFKLITLEYGTKVIHFKVTFAAGTPTKFIIIEIDSNDTSLVNKRVADLFEFDGVPDESVGTKFEMVNGIATGYTSVKFDKQEFFDTYIKLLLSSRMKTYFYDSEGRWINCSYCPLFELRTKNYKRMMFNKYQMRWGW